MSRNVESLQKKEGDQPPRAGPLFQLNFNADIPDVHPRKPTYCPSPTDLPLHPEYAPGRESVGTVPLFLRSCAVAGPVWSLRCSPLSRVERLSSGELRDIRKVLPALARDYEYEEKSLYKERFLSIIILYRRNQRISHRLLT